MFIQWLCYFENGKQEPWSLFENGYPLDLSKTINAYDPCPHVADIDRLDCEAHQALFLENRHMVLGYLRMVLTVRCMHHYLP